MTLNSITIAKYFSPLNIKYKIIPLLLLVLIFPINFRDDDLFFSLNFNKRSNKIIKIVAGNGNQFFQYALGLMIEKYIGVDVYFDYSSYGCNGIQSSPRYCFNGKTYGRNKPLRLNLFNISNKKIATQDMINKATPIPESTIIEQGFKALNNGENQKLSGYFETNKIYDFDDPENLKIFRENFALKDGIKDESDIVLLIQKQWIISNRKFQILFILCFQMI